MISTGCLTVNLKAIRENWQALNVRVGTIPCSAVIKANAYGLGVVPVARALVAAGCETFFVATMDEAVEVREQVDAKFQLVVLGGTAHSYYVDCVHYNIVPVLTDSRHLSVWAQCCRSAERRWPCIIKLDTGMHRLGLSVAEIHDHLNTFHLLERCSPIMLMSHLACADDPDSLLNIRQLEAFLSIVSKARELLPKIKASLANSAGIFLGRRYFFDMVRPGIALYGANPTPYQPNPMQSVISLQLPITQIRVVNSGETVGYGGEFTASRDTKIATTFGGYADGLPHYLGGRGYGYYRGCQVPIVGRVSMDAIAFDISAVPAHLLSSEFDTIEMLGQYHSIDQLADEANTISYEILTRLGSRFQRIYRN